MLIIFIVLVNRSASHDLKSPDKLPSLLKDLRDAGPASKLSSLMNASGVQGRQGRCKISKKGSHPRPFDELEPQNN